jgi:hypothetical protein
MLLLFGERAILGLQTKFYTPTSVIPVFTRINNNNKTISTHGVVVAAVRSLDPCPICCSLLLLALLEPRKNVVGSVVQGGRREEIA